MIQIGVILVVLSAGSWMGIKKLVKANLVNKLWLLKYIGGSRFLVLLFMCSAASMSILLHIPDARYWITVTPLLFLWLVWCTQCLFERCSKRNQLITCSVLFLVFLHPMFIGRYSNQPLIMSMRERHKSKASPTIAGLYPNAIGTYAFRLDKKIIGVDNFSIAEIENSGYDFVIINSYFRNSLFFSKHIEFMSDFEKNPEQYNYRHLGRTKDKYELSVYAKMNQEE